MILNNDRVCHDRLQHTAYPDSSAQMHMSPDLGARPYRSPGIHHCPFPDPGTYIHIGRHHDDTLFQKSPIPGNTMGNDPDSGLREIPFQRNLVVELKGSRFHDLHLGQ